MPLLSDDLTVWEIAFRWENLDPRKLWIRLPLPVQDHFRNLMTAILSAELLCVTISLEKKEFSPDEKPFSVYYWIDDIYAAMGGHFFNRKLMRHAVVDRYDFKLWCERRNIPLPEFWFPQGWNIEYDLPEGEIHPGHYYYRKHWSPEDWAAHLAATDEDESDAGGGSEENQYDQSSLDVDLKSRQADEKLRPSQEAAAACRQIARVLWEEDPVRRIASVTNDELIQKYGGGRHYQPETVRAWVQRVAPPGVSSNRGRPRKNSGDDE